MLRIFSFFSGCGFLDLGFEKAGYSIETVNEYSEAFLNAYKYARKKMRIKNPHYGYYNCDVNVFLNEKTDELSNLIEKSRRDGSVVGFIGGPPCPDFSIAGKQRGRNGDNGKLSLSYVRLIVRQQPDFFLFENVKGLWSTTKHRLFYDELKRMLSDAGYAMIDRMTNALEYGVAQDRDRILLFGIKKTILNERNASLDDFHWEKYMKYSMEEIDNIPWPEMEDFEIDSARTLPRRIPRELTVEYWFKKNDVTNHPDANRFFIPRAGLQKMLVIPEGDTNKKSYKRLHRWRYSPTAAYGNNEVHLHPYKARRLSVAECLAIQSLPRSFSLPPEMSLSDSFKTIGNGVPFLLSYGIARTIKDFMEVLYGENNGGNNS
ncbi:DNA cytosine methyltransferase [Butyrivibrio sp. AE3003]|uniref:DNA cytosine methyltransferase n=1 Tax=Butyrivibrio sp. AE3003 TaxID=1496721 RepID=UPI00047D9F3D|nr:DNA cytosine methyltransferase [Butyrivibrio sp. AE3003]